MIDFTSTRERDRDRNWRIIENERLVEKNPTGSMFTNAIRSGELKTTYLKSRRYMD